MLTPAQRAMIEAEEALLLHVQTALAKQATARSSRGNLDQDLVALRDQIAEERAEDHAMLVEHMMRLAALRKTQDRPLDLPVEPHNPYFAHLQLEDTHQGAARVRDILIGKRAFIDNRLGVQIVDWRNAPISRVFYCYGEGEAYEERFAEVTQAGRVVARRTLTIEEGALRRIRSGEALLVKRDGDWTLNDLEHSRLAGGVGKATRAPERSLGGKPDQRLPEITALIDPEQFNVISSPRSGLVIIRGGAGTGKTTIALHRVAYLHFEDPARFSGDRVLVITPGDALRRYVARVLPALDVRGVPIATFPDWAHTTLKRVLPELRKRPLTDETPSGAQRLKRHPAFLQILEQAVRDEARAFDEAMEEAGGAPLLEAWVRRRNLAPVQRVQAIRRWLEGPIRKQLAARMLEIQRLLRSAEELLGDVFETWSGILTDRVHLAGALAQAGVTYYEWELDQLVSVVAQQADEPPDFRHLDADRRQGIDGRALDEGELQGRLDVDDLAMLLRLVQLKHGRLISGSKPISYEHVVVDEAQDLSPLSLKVLIDAATPGSPVTLAGDTAQRVVLDNGFASWSELISVLKIKAHILPPLAISYRSTQQVMQLARHALGDLATEGAPRDAREGAPVELMRFEDEGEAVLFLADALRSLRQRERRATVALVARTPMMADLYYEGLKRAEISSLRRVRDQEFEFTPGIDLTDVYQIKGLEYDYVVILDATAAAYPETVEARHLFHVAATRAAHQLWLIAAGAPSPLLPPALVEAASR
ncbi:AAA family ATPase [Myxococcota bacterium]|nr:AAA family ATPase [Myxococcota bacterium]MBU1429013.1 AAA family ATPase [Myxococcota bacterium]MBU1898431.1 AAA family ATPase [Myxococcota bacterium]